MQIKIADMKKIKYDLSFNNTKASKPRLELSDFPLGGTSGKVKEKIPNNIDAPDAI